MPDLGPAFALLAAIIFLIAASGLLLVSLRAAQFRAEEEQFPFPTDMELSRDDCPAHPAASAL
ncbi:hypothetical protein [Methylorubrum suomiense]|uniref:Uncharacterized protein n=1 Tax=Methylorubrum suomiense TaxID=144191 RepID=A0ABQ4V0J0_9HYPH|nr:hypothetical protein BGCPKDLD_3816 [Methylorubrum suomiense]